MAEVWIGPCILLLPRVGGVWLSWRALLSSALFYLEVFQFQTSSRKTPRPSLLLPTTGVAWLATPNNHHHKRLLHFLHYSAPPWKPWLVSKATLHPKEESKAVFSDWCYSSKHGGGWVASRKDPPPIGQYQNGTGIGFLLPVWKWWNFR